MAVLGTFGITDELAASDATATLVVVGIELALIALAGAVAYLAGSWGAGLVGTLRREGPYLVAARRRRARRAVVGVVVPLAIAVLAYNGWWISRGVDVAAEAQELLAWITGDMWLRNRDALARIVAAALAVAVGAPLVRWGLRVVEAGVNRWDRVSDNDGNLARLFTGLHRVLVVAGWLLVVLYAVQFLGAPAGVRAGVIRLVRVYLVVAVGVLVIRSSPVIVETLDALARRFAESRGWTSQYDHLRPVLPTFRACLAYALWVALASLLLLQLGPASALAVWGPPLIQAIGLFFLSRVAIELGQFEIGRRLLLTEGVDDTTRRRRATIAPLVRSSFSYAVYFGTAVLILAALGFNPMPFLAGAGILGLVIGFGAQSLINDVVSGFFILFENTYLVGDVIEAGGGKGVVEAIEFRTTKIRDGDGRVHIIRNGNVKDVINYSKEYTLAVVPVDIAYGADLPWVFTMLREAGARVRAGNPDVLDDTQIDGITGFGATTMTVRTSTRVKPGRHEAAAAALRFEIKEACDRRADGRTVRRELVPVDAAFG